MEKKNLSRILTTLTESCRRNYLAPFYFILDQYQCWYLELGRAGKVIIVLDDRKVNTACVQATQWVVGFLVLWAKGISCFGVDVWRKSNV